MLKIDGVNQNMKWQTKMLGYAEDIRDAVLLETTCMHSNLISSKRKKKLSISSQSVNKSQV